MKRELQEKVFVAELQKRVQQLTTELDLDHIFVVGAISLLLHQIQMEFYEEDEKDE